jgi:putative addiction module CopG family antidote
MDIHLDPETEAIVRRKAREDRFEDAAAVVREAVRQLDERDQRLDALRAAIQIGLDQEARGELIEWTPDLMDRLAAEARQASLEGKKPKRDVVPESWGVLNSRSD